MCFFQNFRSNHILETDIFLTIRLKNKSTYYANKPSSEPNNFDDFKGRGKDKASERAVRNPFCSADELSMSYSQPIAILHKYIFAGPVRL